MSLKSIFQQGMQERRRRRALGKHGRELKEKQKMMEKNLSELGRKAWESKSDISAFPDIKSFLDEAQTSLDELDSRKEELEKQLNELEEKKNRENQRLNGEIKGIEDKKNDLDKRIRNQNSQLETDQKETRQAQARLAAIALERSQSEAKGSDPAAGPEDKEDSVRKLDLLKQEERALQAGINAREEAGKPIEILVSSLREESEGLQKQLDEQRKERNTIVSGFDERIAAVKSNLSKNNSDRGEMIGKRDSQYRLLGEKLAADTMERPGLEKEKAAVIQIRDTQAAIQAEIDGLENEKDEKLVSAYKKMMAMIIGGVLLLAAVVVALVILFSPGESSVSPAGISDRGGSTPAISTTSQVSSESGGSTSGVGSLSDIKAKSEALQGGEIRISGENELVAVLPNLSGWQRREPEYTHGTYGEMETAALQADYSSGSDQVRVHITDAGTASALLQGMKIALAMKVNVDTAERIGRVTEINGIPAMEKLDKQDGEASIGLVYKDRYVVDLTTRAKGGLELLRRFAAGMDLSALR